MRIEHLHVPKQADKRNVVIDGRRIVNTAAKQSNIIYLFDRGRVQVPEEIAEREPLKVKAPQ